MSQCGVVSFTQYVCSLIVQSGHCSIRWAALRQYEFTRQKSGWWFTASLKSGHKQKPYSKIHKRLRPIILLHSRRCEKCCGDGSFQNSKHNVETTVFLHGGSEGLRCKICNYTWECEWTAGQAITLHAQKHIQTQHPSTSPCFSNRRRWQASDISTILFLA